MKTPQFWYPTYVTPNAAHNDHLPWWGYGLVPLAHIYHLGAKIHQKLHTPGPAPLPTLCVGNIVAGGAGKTPVALALMKLILQSGMAQNPAFLTRGFGRHPTDGQTILKLSSALLSVPDFDPYIYGDEACLLARSAAVYITAQRGKGAAQAREDGCDFLILDDGLQNYELNYMAAFCVVDGAMGLGNGRLIPAGPLRQRLEDALSRINAFVMVGEDQTGLTPFLTQYRPVLQAQRRVTMENFNPAAYVGFCGLGMPQKFHQTLKSLHVDLLDFFPYPDHYAYTDQDIDFLMEFAMARQARLVTTEKDWVKLSGKNFAGTKLAELCDVVKLEIDFDAQTQGDILKILQDCGAAQFQTNGSAL
ncbi:MAG: tetraacyldisaccharide 4'-kinase [Alphaproteobacteria bacterium]|nr:tetraacyldisaccharide 4'-kinase [Alphaproteobacteria bacterium]